MAKAYVNFQVSPEVVAKTYEALQLAKQSGTVRKGANEVTKSVERGLATFVVIAEDVEPEEVVIHLPKLCEQKKIAYSYVPAKIELGKSIGMSIPCAAISVEAQGGAAAAIKDIISKITGTVQKEQKPASATKAAATQPAQEQKKPAAPKPPKAPAPAAAPAAQPAAVAPPA
jgi:large subunit ribosomal protein L7Ae